ncbi:hypothetical protein E7X23_26795, partial [Bacteroides fragilis]
TALQNCTATYFSDNMVLQQQTNAPIWGEAQPMILSGTALQNCTATYFSDNMVLQQQTNAPIWGEAQPM